MLVLTRKANETLRIGSEIRVTVLGHVGKQVRLGIEAPRDVVVVREELYERVAEANRLAATVGDALPEDGALRTADAPLEALAKHVEKKEPL